MCRPQCAQQLPEDGYTPVFRDVWKSINKNVYDTCHHNLHLPLWMSTPTVMSLMDKREATGSCVATHGKRISIHFRSVQHKRANPQKSLIVIKTGSYAHQ